MIDEVTAAACMHNIALYPVVRDCAGYYIVQWTLTNSK